MPKNPSAHDIGQRILQRLNYLKMTQAELASQFGVEKQTMSQYVNGKRDIRASDLPRLAELLGVKVGYLVSEEDINDEDVPTLIALYEGMNDEARKDLFAFAEMQWRRKRKEETTHGAKAE
jgi:transcriptional regulator with XRE-family HTH domain